MNKNLYFLCILTTLVVLSCVRQPKFSPEETAKEFLIAVEHGDWDVAKKFATDAASADLELMEAMGEEPKRRKPAIKRVEETHDRATAYYYYVRDEERERELDMVFTEGEGWKVEFSKADHKSTEIDDQIADMTEIDDDGRMEFEREEYDEYYDLEGDIDYDLDVEMNIRIRNGRVEGSYIYSKIGKPIALSGMLDTGSGTLEIYEYDQYGEITGIFNGTLSKGGKFEGFWAESDGADNLTFRLEKNGEGENRYHTDISENNVEVVINNDLLYGAFVPVRVEDLLVRSTPHRSGDEIAELYEDEMISLTGNYSFHHDEIELRGTTYTALWYELNLETYEEVGWVYGGGLKMESIELRKEN